MFISLNHPLCVHCSGHNWNTLFVGANSVVDVMADKYGTTKDKILDAVSIVS